MLARLFRRGMSCEDVLSVLQSYLDGEIDEETARMVLEHLDKCKVCDQESDVYRRIKISLSSKAVEADPQIMLALSSFTQRLTDGEFD